MMHIMLLLHTITQIGRRSQAAIHQKRNISYTFIHTKVNEPVGKKFGCPKVCP